MGSVVPIIYCKREGEYGGLRVNTNLLWSQVLSVGGGQFFKGLFLVGEAGVEIDYEQIALGNNTLASYELVEGMQKQVESRCTTTTKAGGFPLPTTNAVSSQIMTLERKLAASLTFIASSIVPPFAKRSSQQPSRVWRLRAHRQQLWVQNWRRVHACHAVAARCWC